VTPSEWDALSKVDRAQMMAMDRIDQDIQAYQLPDPPKKKK